MASREAIVNKRTLAVMRLQRLLGVQFRPAKAGPEYQHAADLETIADALERWESHAPRAAKAARADAEVKPADESK